jgi:hypothetical protein
MQGKQVEIRSVSPESGPRRIVLVLDASASMDDERNFEVFLVKTFLDINHDNSIGLIIFSTGVDATVNLSEGRTRIPSELARLESSRKQRGLRKTALRDALSAAANLLRPAQFGDAIYVISDGDDNASKVKDSQAEDELIRAGVRLFALVPRSSPRSEIQDLRGTQPGWLRLTAAATGGEAIFFNPSDQRLGLNRKHPEVDPTTKVGRDLMVYATRGFAHEISNPYRLTLKLPEPLSKSRDWDLSVLDIQGRVNADLRIHYPQRLAPCP